MRDNRKLACIAAVFALVFCGSYLAAGAGGTVAYADQKPNPKATPSPPPTPRGTPPTDPNAPVTTPTPPPPMKLPNGGSVSCTDGCGSGTVDGPSLPHWYCYIWPFNLLDDCLPTYTPPRPLE